MAGGKAAAVSPSGPPGARRDEDLQVLAVVLLGYDRAVLEPIDVPLGVSSYAEPKVTAQSKSNQGGRIAECIRIMMQREN